jgi:hypothetical protein
MVPVKKPKPSFEAIMLASDLLMDVRAARAISGDQVDRLERMVFESGVPSGDQLDLVFLIDTYLMRRDPRWAELMARAAMAALVEPQASGTAKRAALAATIARAA